MFTNFPKSAPRGSVRILSIPHNIVMDLNNVMYIDVRLQCGLIKCMGSCVISLPIQFLIVMYMGLDHNQISAMITFCLVIDLVYNNLL